MKKIILILITILLHTAANADHYKSIIDIENFDPKQHCSKKKSLLVPTAKVFPGGEFIKFDSYSGFDQRAVIVGAHKKHPVEITSYLLLPEGSGKVPIVYFKYSLFLASLNLLHTKIITNKENTAAILNSVPNK